MTVIMWRGWLKKQRLKAFTHTKYLHPCNSETTKALTYLLQDENVLKELMNYIVVKIKLKKKKAKANKKTELNAGCIYCPTRIVSSVFVCFFFPLPPLQKYST